MNKDFNLNDDVIMKSNMLVVLIYGLLQEMEQILKSNVKIVEEKS